MPLTVFWFGSRRREGAAEDAAAQPRPPAAAVDAQDPGAPWRATRGLTFRSGERRKLRSGHLWRVPKTLGMCRELKLRPSMACLTSVFFGVLLGYIRSWRGSIQDPDLQGGSCCWSSRSCSDVSCLLAAFLSQLSSVFSCYNSAFSRSSLQVASPAVD